MEEGVLEFVDITPFWEFFPPGCTPSPWWYSLPLHGNWLIPLAIIAVTALAWFAAERLDGPFTFFVVFICGNLIAFALLPFSVIAVPFIVIVAFSYFYHEHPNVYPF